MIALRNVRIAGGCSRDRLVIFQTDIPEPVHVVVGVQVDLDREGLRATPAILGVARVGTCEFIRVPEYVARQLEEAAVFEALDSLQEPA